MKNNKKLITGIGANVYDTLIMLPEYPTEDTKMKAGAISSVGGRPTATDSSQRRSFGGGDVTVGPSGVAGDDRDGSPCGYGHGTWDGVCRWEEDVGVSVSDQKERHGLCVFTANAGAAAEG